MKDAYLTKNFIERAKQIHPKSPYNYSKVSCTKFSDYVTITCRIHGDFDQQAYAHITGRGCPSCGHSTTQEDFKKFLLDKFKLKLISTYEGVRKPITVFCNVHGKVTDIAENFNHGGCPRCKYPYRLIEDFLVLATRIHGPLKFEYNDLEEPLVSSTRLNITCLKCNNNFFPTISNHIRHSSGCPHCWKSRKNSEVEIHSEPSSE